MQFELVTGRQRGKCESLPFISHAMFARWTIPIFSAIFGYVLGALCGIIGTPILFSAFDLDRAAAPQWNGAVIGLLVLGPLLAAVAFSFAWAATRHKVERFRDIEARLSGLK
jgi:integral membrane sensor domain MASE1